MSKTGRVNKTQSQLKTVWNQLDRASGELYNAFENINHMVDVPKDVQDTLDRIDVDLVDELRNKIEEMYEEVEKNKGN